MDNKTGNMVEIAALWIQEGKDGTKYMSGTLGNAKVFLFKNARKEPGSKQPDYRLCLAPAPKEKKPAVPVVKPAANPADEW